MGIFFKSTCSACWEREENCNCSREEKEKAEFRKNNFVYKQLKKAKYKGIELNEGDMICQDKGSDWYVIRDFKDNGCPIVHLVSNNSQGCRDFEWNFDTLLVLGINFNNIKDE